MAAPSESVGEVEEPSVNVHGATSTAFGPHRVEPATGNPSESSSMIRSSLLVLSGSGCDTIWIDASVSPVLMRMSTGRSRP